MSCDDTGITKQNVCETLYTPERLAYWYLRLNGYLLLENFIIHHDVSSNQETDADLLGVRFQHRAENLNNPMHDDRLVVDDCSYCDVVIAEVKTGQCRLNGPWTLVVWAPLIVAL